MDYNLLPFRQSPNFTPGPQVRAFYGRPRTIEFGAGHWWDDPTRNPSFQGVVNTLLNPARQASANEVIGDQIVQPMVHDGDASWATGSANPFTWSVEVDPHIIYKWWAGGDKARAERIFQTLARRIADKGFHNLPWRPHKFWMNTGCNPIPWDQVMARAQEIVRERQTPVVPEWKKNLKKWDAPRTLYARDDNTPLRNLANTPQVIKNFTKATPFEIAAETKVGNYVYYLTKYAYENGTGQGFDEYELEEAPKPDPEWMRNLVDIADVELFVLPAEGTPVYDLNTGKVIPDSVIAKGTAVSIAKKTIVGGKPYLLSSYAVTKGMPNGIFADHLGVPVEPPKQEKPEWLENWQDIEDVVMYTRADVPVVDLLNGETVDTIKINTPVEIASATEWHGQKYFITKYSTDKKAARGILVAHLDKDPIKDPEEPLPPAPEQPSLDPQVQTFLQLLVKLITDFLAKFKK